MSLSPTLISKKSRFQTDLSTLYTSCSTLNCCLLDLLVTSIGSLLQKYSGPDLVAIPLEVIIRYGEDQDRIEIYNCVFDLKPVETLKESIEKIHKDIRKYNVEKCAKMVPSIWIPLNCDGIKNDEIMQSIEEQALDEYKDEPAKSLIHNISNLDDLVKLILLKKPSSESPLDWEITIQTAPEQVSAELQFSVTFIPGVTTDSSYFSPLGFYIVNPENPNPKITINAEILFPPLVPKEKGDPRLRSSSHLTQLWTAIENSTDPNLKNGSIFINQLPWISESEYAELMNVHSGMDAAANCNSICPLDPQERLVDIFANTVKLHSHRRALLSPAENLSLTYAEFDDKSTQLAHALRAAGVTGGCVSMMLPRSLMMYIAIMGILKSGAAYVPIDFEYPADRVAYIASDSDSHLLLTNSKLKVWGPTMSAFNERKNGQLNTTEDLENLSDSLRDTLPPFTGKVWCLDILMDGEFSKLSTEVFPAATKPEDLAYIIYTSGSTGRPKGVMLENRNVCALVRAERLLYKATPDDVTWQGFSIAFDASVEELWLAWAAGGTLFCASYEMLHSGPELANVWAEHKLTIVSTVPTLLTMLDDENLSSLRILILGGEACHRDLVQKWSKGRRMINTYGPTEATVIATSTDVFVEDPIVTIGKPIAHYSSYIIDPTTLRLCPKGVPGELLLGGPGLARGYVKRPELTETVFIKNPFRRPNTNDPERLYRAGDLCRWSEHGEIEFMGRIDAQVKLRGYRVELAEIESVIFQVKEIVVSCVTHIMKVGGVDQLVAFVVPAGNAPDPSNPDALPPLLTAQQEADIKEKIRVKLPPYMIPSIFETLYFIPTLPSGKANRKQLPQPRVKSATISVVPTSSPPIAPSSKLEEKNKETPAQPRRETITLPNIDESQSYCIIS